MCMIWSSVIGPITDDYKWPFNYTFLFSCLFIPWLFILYFHNYEIKKNETDDSMRDYHVSFSYYAHRNQRLIVSSLLYVLSEVPFLVSSNTDPCLLLPPFRELFALYSCFFCDLSHCLFGVFLTICGISCINFKNSLCQCFFLYFFGIALNSPISFQPNSTS